MIVPLAIVAALASLTSFTLDDSQSLLDFNRDVRPVLSDKCFACHGPDATQRKGDLRLDTREGAFSESKSGSTPVVPRSLDDSELIQRIISEEPDRKMPPAKSGKALTASQVELLKRWVEEGAEFQDHWSFVPPRKVEPPVPATSGWVRNPIDAFILARLETGPLRPSREADRATLLRRLSLDLIGLPPTIGEIDAFLADTAPDAYEKQVERLLRSPHHGERWGRVWLDAARYADSDGYEKDKPRFVWSYRDWVVSAINRDLPYDRFIIEQIAGDLLPGATQDQIVATGFLRNSMINEEGGVDPEQFRMEAMFDRMDALGKSVLGLAVGCAQCHNHKYDPITQEDYYRMFAFLNDCHEASVAVYTPEERDRRDDVLRHIREVEDGLKQGTPDWAERMAAWEAKQRGERPTWRTLKPELDTSGGQKHYLLDDGSVLAAGYAPTKHTTDFTAKSDLPRITAVRLELLNDPSLPRGGPGRSILGLCALTEFKVVVEPPSDKEKAREIKIKSVTANVNPTERPLDTTFDDKSGKKRVTGPAEFAIDGSNETAWGIDIGPGRSNVPRQAVFVLEQPIESTNGATLTIKLVQNHGGWNSDDNQNNNLGRFRFCVTDAEGPEADPLSPIAREALDTPPEKRTAKHIAALFEAWRTTVPQWREANDRIEALWREHPAGTSQLVLQERELPRMTSVLQRGDFLRPVRTVTPGVPSFLNPIPEGPPANRLTFARWLVARDAPTTARAFVNRVWQSYFGTGLVSTSEDLGSQCDAPSHPELLDWLAVAFMDNGWSMKALHRAIVTSSTYRQSSTVRAEHQAKDPANRLLARGPRFRVDAEVVRDIALAASGLLDARIGGPSVQPPAPDFLFQPPASYGPKTWKETTGPGRYRRALYTFRYRSVPFPMLQAFDAPNGDFACVRRTRSNTPLQALTTLNEPIFLECARNLALRTLWEGGRTDVERMTTAFRRCLARMPTDAELASLMGLLERQTSRFAREGAGPWDLAANDPKAPPPLPEGVPPARLAAWTAVARVLLNLDETITKE